MKQTLGHMVRLDSQGRDIQLRLHGIRPRVGNLSWLLGGGCSWPGGTEQKGSSSVDHEGLSQPGVQRARGKCPGQVPGDHTFSITGARRWPQPVGCVPVKPDIQNTRGWVWPMGCSLLTLI